MVRFTKKALFIILAGLLTGEAAAWSNGNVAGSVLCLSQTQQKKRVPFSIRNGVSSSLLSSSPNQLNMIPVDISEVVSSSTMSISATGNPPLLGALAAYSHYLSFMIITACLVVERLTVKANMSEEEETRLAITDSVLGLAGLLLVVSGYYRASVFEKGLDYYSHEPIFWLKMVLVSIFGAMSFFPTTKIIQRAIAQRTGNFVPMSEKLAKRMTSLLNAELLALFTIPASATVMARGIAYTESIPWQAEAALVPIVLVGLGGKYIKEALDWKEDE